MSGADDRRDLIARSIQFRQLHSNFSRRGPFSDSKLPPTRSTLFWGKVAWGVLIWEFAMSAGPQNKQNLLVRGANNALPSPHGDDNEFFDVLVLALEEVPGSQRPGYQRDESPHRETDDLVLLLEENTRLRKLVVQLSNRLGDLPPFASVTPIGGQMKQPIDHSIQKRVRNG
jgi:hypothetical protein